MRPLTMALLLTCVIPSSLHAQPSSSASVQTEPAWAPRASRYWRKTGVGLLIGSGVCLALGATFVGLASKANSDALAGRQYHPSFEDDRDHYQIAYGALFLTGGAALISGLVLVW